ncbi:metallophosphoesterase family protein [Maricaulis sp.]|uniref:metallophosphoesterase family protein n=1 Tax=Maricaulis sp. TaxID=1486257 RepID=UPI003A8DAC34
MIISSLRQIFRGRAPASIPGVVYAIGDIHGRRDLLLALLEKIAADDPHAASDLIFLGDYIDRGPDSAGVIDVLLSDPRIAARRPVFLKGNHEATLLAFMEDAEHGPAWNRFGGADTLVSYEVRPPRGVAGDPAAWEGVRSQLNNVLPAAHLQFLNGLVLFEERGDYFFVHAGIDPNRPVKAQGEAEYLWIRDEFLQDERRFSHVIVHGHTPEPEPVANRRRVGTDTGAYASGRLTAARIDSAGVRFLST